MNLFAALYTDEDTSNLVATLLRSRGFDILTTIEAGRMGYSDAEQLSYAASQSSPRESPLYNRSQQTPVTRPDPMSATPAPLSARSRLFDRDTALYIGQRLIQALITLLLASALCFFVIQLAPGDYLSALKENPQISPERVAELQAQFGLDKSWWEQYLRWLWQVVSQGNFGESFAYKRSVASLLLERVPATLLLAFSSLILTWALAIPLGIIAAVRQNQPLDRLLRSLSYLGQGFPSFVAALLLLILAQNLSPLLPVGDMTSLNYDDLTPLGKALDLGWHLLLPTLALTLTSLAGLQRITRGELLDVLRRDYVRTARAKGLPESRVIYVHALRNAVNPLVTLLGFEFSNLLSGAFITEQLFNWPGLGRLILQAVMSQDLYLVMASLMMGAVMLILGNLLADLLLKVVDPRVKLGADLGL